MAIKTHKVTLSLDNPCVIQSGINVQSFDKQSIQISIELTKNDEVFQVPSDATIRVSLLKLARQEQKIIVDVPNTNRESIDWVVPDYLDGHQGTVRVGVYLVSGAENVDLGYFTILSNVSDIDKMADEFTDNVFQGWEQIEADLNELNLTIAQTKLDLADDLTQIDNTIANINTLASDFTTDVATKQADVTSKYNAFDTSVTQANQTIDDILALQPQFQSVLDETTDKDVISAPEIILARNGATTLMERLDSEKAEVSAQLQQIATVSADDMIKLENGDVTKGLQRSIDTALTLNKARVLWAGTYEVNKTLVIERLNEDNNPQIVFFGGGQLKKAPNFTGDRLLQIKIGFHDEDNIVFENISFDGVNNTINGVDTFDEQISYKEDGSKSEDGHQSKFISFNNCTFHRFYRGARLSSLSYNFISCFFQNNVYGTFLNLAANNNSFIACQFRRNGVGVHIKQLSGNYGTMNNAFFNCIFESNRNSGLIVDGAGYVSLFGGYFENNCYNIDNTIIVPPINCDILSIGWGGVGRLLVDGVFFLSNNSPVAIYGDHLPNVTVKNSGNIKISAALIENGDFDLELENISIRDVNYPSTFLINGVRYGSKKGMIHMIADYDKGVSSKVTHVSYNVPITDLSNVSIARFKSNTTDVSEVRIKIFLNGLTSGGNTSHEGYIERDFFISRSTKPLETFNAKSIGNTRIGKANSDSGSGDGVTTKDLLQDTSELILTSENYNEQKISVTNLINDSMINWGQYNRIEAFIVIEMVGFQTTFTLEDFPLDPITFIN